MVKLPQTVFKPVEVQVVQVVFDTLAGLKCFACDVLGNLALAFDHCLADTLVH